MYFIFLVALTAKPILFESKNEILEMMLKLKNLERIIDVF